MKRNNYWVTRHYIGNERDDHWRSWWESNAISVLERKGVRLLEPEGLSIDRDYVLKYGPDKYVSELRRTNSLLLLDNIPEYHYLREAGAKLVYLDKFRVGILGFPRCSELDLTRARKMDGKSISLNSRRRNPDFCS